MSELRLSKRSIKSIKSFVNRIVSAKIVFEFLSITFAVFLGLFLNQWRENHNKSIYAEQSLININKEIAKNLSTTKETLNDHQQLKISIDSLILLGDSINSGSLKFSLNFQLLSSTSWRAAQLTQAITDIDPEMVLELSEIYQLQEYFETIVKDFILKNIYADKEKYNRQLYKNIQQLLNTLIPIEENLLKAYEYILKKENKSDNIEN